MTARPTPFRLHVPDEAIADLRERLARTRWPDQAPGEPWAYGTDVAYLQSLVAHWRDGFDWRPRASQDSAKPMLKYGDTRSLDVSTWTSDERHRLIQFFRILLEWEAARPHNDASIDPDPKARAKRVDNDSGAVCTCLLK